MAKKRARRLTKQAAAISDTLPDVNDESVPTKARPRSKKSPTKKLNRLSVDALEARSILLVDEHGKRRASLDCSAADGRSGGHTVMHFYDEAGQVAITFQVAGSNGTSVTLWNRNFSPAVSLAVNHSDPLGGAGVTIADRLGRPHLLAGVSESGSSEAVGPSAEIVIVNGDVRRRSAIVPKQKRAKTSDA